MPTVANVIANPDFELGDVGWVKNGGWKILIDQGAGAYTGLWNAHIDTSDPGVGSQTSDIYNENVAPVSVGQSITATARVYGVGADGNVAAVFIQWLDGAYAVVGRSQGNSSNYGSRGVWEVSTITASAPAGAVYARIGIYGKAVTNGAIRADTVSWTYVNDRNATLVSPINGSSYQTGTTVPLQITLTGTAPAVASVVYKDGTTTLATVTSGDFSYNITTLTVGNHSITAIVTLVGGRVITTAANVVTISAVPIPTINREFRASNSYTYLVGNNFSGLSAAMPLTAKVTGIEVTVDYTTKVISRSKNLGVVDPLGANPNVLFDTISGGTVEAVLLNSIAGAYTKDGSHISSTIPIVRDGYNVAETGISENKKWTVFQQATSSSVTLGGKTALFGVPSIAAADFMGKSLGIKFYPNIKTKPSYADSGDGVVRFFIDKLRLRVYFDAGSADYYFASAGKTKVIKAILVSASLTGGDFITGDASGVLQVQPTLTIIDGTQTWIGDDWTVHAAYPPTNSNQVGTVANRPLNDGIGMKYNGLPSAKAVVNNRSRYEFITTNFFAVKKLDSIYGVHGLPRAFAYNKELFYKIYTQPDATRDQPRHVANHHGHLALGFDDGRVDISVIGQPYNFDGAKGASEWSIGDKITGLLPLSGTILGMFGSKSIWGLNGTTVDNFATQVITPNIGAIEYTVTDMGFPVYANAYGVYTLSQTQQYGDYLGTPMSQDISPWLRPRLVRRYTSTQEVVVAWPVRSKNQYRLAFADGYVMSMTLNAGQQSAPTFSFQQYIINNTDAQAPIPDPVVIPSNYYADFSYVVTTSSLVVPFTDTSNTPTVTSYSWDFGDSTTSTLQNPSHTYAASGTYTVIHTVVAAGITYSSTHTVKVSSAAVGNTAVFFTFVTTDLVTNFTATYTGVAPVSYAWDFGDGTTGTGMTPAHTYPANGQYLVKLTATKADDTTVTTSSTMIAWLTSTGVWINALANQWIAKKLDAASLTYDLIGNVTLPYTYTGITGVNVEVIGSFTVPAGKRIVKVRSSGTIANPAFPLTPTAYGRWEYGTYNPTLNIALGVGTTTIPLPEYTSQEPTGQAGELRLVAQHNTQVLTNTTFNVTQYDFFVVPIP